MKHLQVRLPTGVNADLHYMHDYQTGGPFDYIQLARTNSLFMAPNPLHVEELYWKGLEVNRTAFATQVPSEFDLIVDAPSNSGWHRPYSSAVCRIFHTLPCIHLIKNPKDPTGKDIRAFRDDVTGWDTAKRVLIVDDVFNSGKTAATVIAKLFQYGTNKAATFMIACPLRMPPQPGGSIDEINAQVAAISAR